MSSTQMHVLYSENRMLGDVLGSRPTGHMSNLLKKWHFIRGTQLNLWKMTSSGLFLFFQWCKSYFVQVNVGRKQRIKGAGVEEREREREREREGGREGGCTCCSLVVAPLVPSPNLSSWCELTCTELTTLLSVYFVILSPPFFINSFHSLLLLRILVELPNLSNIYWNKKSNLNIIALFMLCKEMFQ